MTPKPSKPNLVLLGLTVSFLVSSGVRADDWPQWLGPNRDGLWRETGIVQQFPKEGLKVRWRTPIGAGYAGPAVAQGRVYVTDRLKDTNAPTGKKLSQGKERVLCLDEATGKVLWQYAHDCTYQVGYPAGPRTTPLVHGGKVYTLGTMGDLLCLDADKGTLLWQKNFRKEYNAPVQNWGFSAHPLLDGDRLICVVGGDAIVVALHKDTGKEIWQALKGEAGYSPPMIYQAGGRRQLIVWHPRAVSSLDPETGKPFWSQPFNVRMDIAIATSRLEGDRLFVSSFYNGSLMLKLAADSPAASVLWRGKSSSEQSRLSDGLHCLMSTPYLKDGHIYGVCSYGQLRCLRADTGERLWETLQPTTGGPEVRWGNAFLIPQGDRCFLFNEKGELILARVDPRGYEEISRAHILAPTNQAAGRPVVWSHPAFANRSMFCRNDREIVCVILAGE